MPQTFWAWLAQAGWKQFVVKAVINVAAAAVVNKLTTPSLKDRKKSVQSLTVNVRGTTEHQRIIYGETLAGGILWYLNTAGEENQALYQGIVVAGHEIENIGDMWIDNAVIPEASIDWSGDGSVDSGDFRGDTSVSSKVVYFKRYLGADGQTASTEMDAAFGEINNNHIGAGQAWFMARLDYFKEQAQVWSGGVPNAIRGVVKGKKVYDPRSDSTQSFGTGPHRLTNSLTWGWSDNPALCWADYMIDNILGFGESYSKIDYGYVASAAEICEATVYTPVGTDNRFRCNGILTTGETYEHNIKRILSSMNGQASLLNGTWKVRAWGYETPTLQFTEDDLRDDLKINLHPEERERFNTVRGVFVDKEKLWNTAEFPAVVSSEYLSRDNDVELESDISLHMTKDVYMAQRLAFGLLEQSDNEITMVFPSNYKTLPAEVGGTIKMSNDKMGWTDKVFRVERFNFYDGRGIDMLLREDSPNSYVDVATNEYTVSSQGGYSVSNPGVPPPSNFQATSVLDGISVSWDTPAARLYEYVEIYRNHVNSFANAALVKQTRNDQWIDVPPEQGQFYYWGRAVNYAGDVSSPAPQVGSGDVIRWTQDGALLADPTFEKTPLGVGVSEAFWANVNTISLGQTDWQGYFEVASDSGGIKTAYLKNHVLINSEQQYPSQGVVSNTKFTPIIEAAGYHLSFIYRVPTFVNITSAQLGIEFQGRFAHTLGRDWSYASIGSRGVPVLTNSIGWTTYSESLVYSDFDFNTNSSTHIGAGLTFDAFADTSTGEIEFNIDKVIWKEIL